MLRGTPLFLWAAVCCSCRPPEAPETLDELASYLFEHVWDDDEDYLQPGLENLVVWLDAHFEETSVGYEVTNLDPDAVASVTGEPRNLEGLIGAAVGYDVGFSPEEVVDVMVFHDPLEVYPGDYEEYTREYLSDTECFKERTCSKLSYNVHLVANYPLGITGESDTHVQYHWVELENGPAAIYRNWTRWSPEISADWLKVKQQYYLSATLPKADGTTRRIAAMWLEAEIVNANIPESMALNMTIDTMAKAGGQMESYLTGLAE